MINSLMNSGIIGVGVLALALTLGPWLVGRIIIQLTNTPCGAMYDDSYVYCWFLGFGATVMVSLVLGFLLCYHNEILGIGKQVQALIRIPVR